MTEQKQKATVLIVDDDPNMVEIISRFIASPFLRVLRAIDGLEAIDIINKNSIDLVISDLVMPKKSGMGLLQLMAKQGLDVPFVLITGHVTQDSKIQALKLGAFDYLEKPIKAETMKTIAEEGVRVSQERRALRESLSAEDASKLQSDKEARLAIINMKSIRQNDGQGLVTGDIKALFVSETRAQLDVSQKTIVDLQSTSKRTFGLSYLFRVMQAIKQAAHAVGATDIEQVASLAENCFSILRSKPSTYDPKRQAFLTKIAACLSIGTDAFAKGQAKFPVSKVMLADLSEYCSELSTAANLERAG